MSRRKTKRVRVPLTQQEIVNNTVQEYLIEKEELLKDYNVREIVILNFPKRKKLPWICRIAWSIIRSQGGILDTRFEVYKKK